MRPLFETLEPRTLFSTLIVGPGQAFSTLQAAANAVSAGDTVIVEPGTYAGFRLSNRASGSAAAPIIFNFQSGAQIVSSDGSTNDAIDVENCNYITIEGAAIANGGDVTRAGIRLADCNNASILNNIVSGAGSWGIYTSHCSGTLIQGNTSDGNGAHGIYIANASTNVQVLNNTLFSNANCGIHVNGDDSQGGAGLITDLTVANNVIYNNGSTGGSAINCDGVQDSVIANNLLYGNLHTGIALFDGDSAAGPAADVVANNTVVMPGLTAIEVDQPASPNFIFKNIFIGSNSAAPGTSMSQNVVSNSIPPGLFAPGGFQPADPSAGIGVGSGVDSDPATQLVFLQQPANFTAGVPTQTSFVVELEDQSGNLVVNNRSRITLSFITGSVTHIVTSVTDNGGVAAFNNIALTTAGSYTIQASDGALLPATSTPVQVDPAAPAKLVYVNQPAALAAGAVNPPLVVALTDAFNNIATNADANVTLAVAAGPPGATLDGTSTVAAVNGIAVFDSVSLTKAGRYRFIASEGALSLATKLITIVPAAPANIAFAVAPANIIAGQQFAPRLKVAVADAFGNPAPNGTPVTLSITTGPAGAAFVGRPVALTLNGIATFPNVALHTAGDYSLTAAAGSVSVASSTFTVSPAPASTAVNTPFNVQIALVDRFGNLATNNASTLTAALATHPLHALLAGPITAPVINGVAEFDALSLTLPGNYTLRFTDRLLHLISPLFQLV
jgi:parallel beta-helix repeat protein